MIRTCTSLGIFAILSCACNDASSSRNTPPQSPQTPQQSKATPVADDGKELPGTEPEPKKRPKTTPDSEIPANDRTAPSTSPSAGSSFPSYLFSLEDAKKILPLVEPFNKSNLPKPLQHDVAFSRQRDVVANFINQGLALDALKPGRQITVIINANVPDASTSDDVITVNPILFTTDALVLGITLCHEAAHSARNHTVKLIPVFEKLSGTSPETTRLNQMLNAFATSQVDFQNKVYHHKKAALQPVLDEWNRFWKDIAPVLKRAESEADIVGAQICGQFGFSQDEIATYAKTVFANPPPPFDLATPDGDYPFNSPSVDVFVNFLMGGDQTHPSFAERNSQFQRTTSLVKTNPQATIASQWKSGFGALKGTTLVAGTPSHVHGFGCSHAGRYQIDFLERALRSR